MSGDTCFVLYDTTCELAEMTIIRYSLRRFLTRDFWSWGRSRMQEGELVGYLEPLRRLEASRAFSYYPNLKRVRSHFRDHLTDPLSLGEAAAIAGFERCYFSTYFHRRVNLRFRDWVSGLRVAKAAQFIAERDCALSWVSDEVGFANQRAFQRAFKRWTGLTARDFQRKARKAARTATCGPRASGRTPAGEG